MGLWLKLYEYEDAYTPVPASAEELDRVISIKLKTCSGTSNGVVCTKVDISMNVSMSSFESFFVYGTDKVGVDLTMLMNTQVVKNRIMDCNCHTD